MSRFWTVVGLCLVLFGCRRVTIDKASEGTRLKLITLKDSAGNELSQGFYDATLKIDCAFVADDRENKRYHCLPAKMVYQNEIFSDAACATQVAVVSAYQCLGGAPQYAQVYRPGVEACTSVYTYYKLGAELKVTAIYRHDDKGGCVADTLNAVDFAHDKFYAVGESVPLTAFAAGDLKAEKDGSRLSGYVLHAADGAVQHLSGVGFTGAQPFFDTSLQTDCSVYKEGDTVRCMPTNVVVASNGSLFADAACTTKLYTQSDGCFATPFKYATLPVTTTSCGTPREIYEAKPQTAAYVQNGPTCSAYQDPPAPMSATHYTVGSQVSLDAFVPFNPNPPDKGSGPLRVDTYKGSDGTIIPYTFYDTKRQAPCVIRQASKTESYCVPEPSLVYFSDAACATPVAVDTPANCNAVDSAPQYAVAYDYTTCPAQVSFYKIDAEITAPAALYFKAIDRCFKVQLQGRHYYSLSAAALSDFPKLTLVHP